MYEDEIPVGKAKDITGQRFGRWTALYRTANQGKSVMWKCRCDCGKEKNVIAATLGKSSNSCGCLQKEQVIERSKRLYTIDITGQKFGRLTVLKMIDKPEDVKDVGTGAWCECQCDCGTIIQVKANWLKTKGVQSCGCLHRETSAQNGRSSAIDLTNKRFGKIVALYPTEKRVRSGSIVWHCICDCGEEKDIPSTDLVQNKTHSCGKCGYQAEQSSKNLLGQTFGKLTVIGKTNKRDPSSGSIIWKCRCECGNIIEIRTNALTSAHTMSCGCLQSKGEYNISKLLNAYQILYRIQEKFETCRFPDTNALAKFDFYIINEKYLIEFDGPQHFFAKGTDWNTEEKFQYTQEHDEYKNQWCRENNIPLIRIPYWKLDTLCIEDLMLETTKFRVV